MPRIMHDTMRYPDPWVACYYAGNRALLAGITLAQFRLTVLEAVPRVLPGQDR
jgi:hypothetical protein